MFRRVFLARLLLAALFGALLVPAQAQEKFSEPALSDPDSWTVVLLPDLQGYAKKACNQPIMEIMTSWIAAHDEALNTKLVLCGHVSGWGFRTDANSAGRPVHQMLFDSQSMGGGYEGNGGDGWIRILEFLPDGRTVRVMTYSPLFALSPTTRQHAWLTEEGNQFTFEFRQR